MLDELPFCACALQRTRSSVTYTNIEQRFIILAGSDNTKIKTLGIRDKLT